MTTDTLPPGCAPLTFDPNDRATWLNKVAWWDDAKQTAKARIEAVDMDGSWPVLVTYETRPGAQRGILLCSTYGWSQTAAARLYDAAPEPVKPREWWGVHKADGNHLWLVAHPNRAQVRGMYPSANIVRLIEAPEEGT